MIKSVFKDANHYNSNQFNATEFYYIYKSLYTKSLITSAMKYIKVLVLLICSFIISCKTSTSSASKDLTIKPVELTFEKDSITLQEINLKPKLYNLILSTKENYIKKYNREPKIISLDLFYDNKGKPLIYIDNMQSLYMDKEWKKFMNIDFTGVAVIDNIPVMITTSMPATQSDFFFNFKGVAKNIQLIYSGDVDYAIHRLIH